MKNKWTGNLGLKILALIFAVVLWIYVANTENPWRERTISIPITIENSEVFTNAGKTFEIANGVSSVSVKVTVRNTDYLKVSADDFSAVVDCSMINDLNGAVKVNVIYNGSLSITYKQVQDTVRIVTEDLMDYTYTIDVKTIGDPADGYKMGDKVCTPATVTVTAPQSVLVEIDSAGVIVDLTGASESIQNTEQPILFYDRLGNTIILDDENVTLSQTTADVSVDILKMDEVLIDFSHVVGTDALADNCRYIGLSADISTVKLLGEPSAVSAVERIVIPQEELDLTGASETMEKDIDLSAYLPDGVEIEGTSTVHVTLQIVRVDEKTVMFVSNRIKWIGKNTEYTYSLNGCGNILQLTLTGYEGELDNLVGGDITLYLDVSGYEPGVSDIPLIMEVADSTSGTIQLASPHSLQVTIAENDTEITEQTETSGEESQTETISEDGQGITDASAEAAGSEENAPAEAGNGEENALAEAGNGEESALPEIGNSDESAAAETGNFGGNAAEEVGSDDGNAAGEVGSDDGNAAGEVQSGVENAAAEIENSEDNAAGEAVITEENSAGEENVLEAGSSESM